LSLLARSGLALLAKALQDGRNVKSDKGRVRYGWYTKQDGSKVPRYHGSEVACIAYAIQEILVNQGYLTEDGNPIAYVNAFKKPEVPVVEAVPAQLGERRTNIIHGSSCVECGAAAVIKSDGCLRCTNCGYIGSCG
jgi:ribonucleoside-diphosphate reductase alpha chain